METLRRFCSANAKDTGFVRPWMSIPFSFGGFSYATDGVVCVRVPRLCGSRQLSEDFQFASAVEHLFAQSPAGIWTRPPSVPLLAEYKTCDECDGLGKKKMCPECGGSGKIRVPSLIQFGDPASGPIFGGQTYAINSDVLEKITTLPGLEINTSPVDCGVFHFRFRGGAGVFMGVRMQSWNRSI